MGVRNPFVGEGVADRYARARPPLHDYVAELILTRQSRVSRAIDVACGTGLSTVPLLAVAEHVVGVDLSSDMLAEAPRAVGVSYVQAAAERLPFDDSAFDLMTICSAIHWFGREALAELHRTLVVGGTLVVYDVWFPAEMVDEPRFEQWMADVCGPRYPSIPKNHANVDALQGEGFRQIWSADRRYEVEMNFTGLVDCLMTHSERIVVIQQGRETEDEQASFFCEGLRFLFPDGRQRSLVFGIRLRAFFRESVRMYAPTAPTEPREL
jgi:SAM-dependent methyltransferase